MTRFVKHALKKVIVLHLYKRYVDENQILIKDIEVNFSIRGCKANSSTLKKKFEHLMIYYPDFAFIFFWRIKKTQYRWRYLFTKDIQCKIFRSTKIEGGMICYHPFATVINAKSIGRNFQFRNGLTIGNKGNDNTLLPTIGNDVTVGANTVIIGDITIGDNVIIGAGAVVVKDIPSHCVVAGNPAIIIREINRG